ncbi:hypothetical protein ACFL96_17760 [Thermoproteota archaeon]
MRKAILIVIVLLLLTVAGCGAKISDIKENTEDYLGKEITLKGEAINAIKLGPLSGFTLKQGDLTIPIASDTIPKEGEMVTVKGTVVKSLLRPYVQASKVK